MSEQVRVAEPIECFITIVTGAPGHGKTKRSLEEIRLYARTDTRTGRKGRKVLIFDTNNEYSEFPTVKYDVTDKNDNGKYLSLLKNVEIRRIAPFKPNGISMTFKEKEKTLIDIMTNYRNGCVLLEDINTYLIRGQSVETISFLCSNRHKGLDIIIHLQSLAAVEPRMFQNAKIIRFHYQADAIDRYKERIPNFELMKIAQLIVNKQYFVGNKYYFLWVDVRENKIIGGGDPNFEKKFEDAVNEYIDNYGSKVEKKNRVELLRQKKILYLAGYAKKHGYSVVAAKPEKKNALVNNSQQLDGQKMPPKPPDVSPFSKKTT